MLNKETNLGENSAHCRIGGLSFGALSCRRIVIWRIVVRRIVAGVLMIRRIVVRRIVGEPKYIGIFYATNTQA